MGLLDMPVERVRDIEVARRQPSLQLVGRHDHATLDLPQLERRGVRLVGRAIGAAGASVFFADDLVVHTVAADARLARLLARIDAFAAHGLAREVGALEPFQPFHWPAPAPTAIDLGAEGIRTVVWATGFRRFYPWLKVPILDREGEIRHDGGITPAQGLYVLGLHFLRRRKSSFIDGVGDDARELADHIAARGTHRRAVA
jgi:putative flavoprotein involved in K+ transport